MSNRVCPWWIGYLLASPVRRWLGQDPVKILSPYVREGVTVLEPGPGMGFFTIPLARLVGPSGKVIAVDLQQKMIDGLKRRAARAGLLDRIDCRVAGAESMALNDLDAKVDFTLAFAVVHEFPDADRFFAEVARTSKPEAHLFLAEPMGHVDDLKFEVELRSAAAARLHVEAKPKVSRNHAALLVRA
jgi:ubiquinone/menaquinone biosynthesis C-methylase UbiE